mmetsp:Transcript_4095/g.10403  ORF Transcript_4095/g.10403 Transcript_4095/m.10403 type:complete len:238 (-) Transcript_4095:470-1183(-)
MPARFLVGPALFDVEQPVRLVHDEPSNRSQQFLSLRLARRRARHFAVAEKAGGYGLRAAHQYSRMVLPAPGSIRTLVPVALIALVLEVIVLLAPIHGVLPKPHQIRGMRDQPHGTRRCQHRRHAGDLRRELPCGKQDERHTVGHIVRVDVATTATIAVHLPPQGLGDGKEVRDRLPAPRGSVEQRGRVGGVEYLGHGRGLDRRRFQRRFLSERSMERVCSGGGKAGYPCKRYGSVRA